VNEVSENYHKTHPVYGHPPERLNVFACHDVYC